MKKFANYEVAEQTTFAEILKSMGAAPPKSDKAEAMVDKLEKSSKFDADYVAGQLEGHQELLKIQDEYISSGKNMANVNLAKLAPYPDQRAHRPAPNHPAEPQVLTRKH